MSELLVWTAATFGFSLSFLLGVLAVRIARAKTCTVDMAVSVRVLGSTRIKVTS
jgi:hypothetical protein